MSGSAEERVQIAESAGRIGERLAVLETEMKDVKADAAALRTDVDALKRFQAWVFGIGTGLGAVMAFLANGVKDWLRTPP